MSEAGCLWKMRGISTFFILADGLDPPGGFVLIARPDVFARKASKIRRRVTVELMIFPAAVRHGFAPIGTLIPTMEIGVLSDEINDCVRDKQTEAINALFSELEMYWEKLKNHLT
ncbi:MAG: hypothetical protein JXB10_09380 [Pirellulales bacterium]|nr:hypothetical protein [Pirellulales bacterium]